MRTAGFFSLSSPQRGLSPAPSAARAFATLFLFLCTSCTLALSLRVAGAPQTPATTLGSSRSNRGVAASATPATEKDILPSLDLHAAAAAADADEIRQLLALGADFAAVDSAVGGTPLHAAALAGGFEACAVLLSVGADCTPVDGLGLTPLHWAILYGHAEIATLLLLSAPSQASALSESLTPLLFAAAVGNVDVVEALLVAGAGTSASGGVGLTPLELAASLGHEEVVQLLLRHSTTDGGATLQPPAKTTTATSPPPTASVAAMASVASASRPAAMPRRVSHATATPVASQQSPLAAGSAGPTEAFVRRVTAEELTPSMMKEAFEASIPLLVLGFAQEWASNIADADVAELRRRWGGQSVQVVFSPDERYQCHVWEDDGRRGDGVDGSSSSADWAGGGGGCGRGGGGDGGTRSGSDDGEGRGGGAGSVEGSRACSAPFPSLREGPTEQMSFAEFVDLLPQHGRKEFFAVQQSHSKSLDEFIGLPALPPRLSHFLESLDVDPETSSNLWVCAPPKLSQLHYDCKDSALLQLKGSKTFTLVDPIPLHGLTVYPCTQRVSSLTRVGEGNFTAELSDRLYSNFPLVNVTNPDYERHPLFRHARVATVDVPAGAALFVPAFWLHQVESYTGEVAEQLNVAINYWFNTGSLAALSRGLMIRSLRSRDPSAIDEQPSTWS